jgi:hypothetical protein
VTCKCNCFANQPCHCSHLLLFTSLVPWLQLAKIAPAFPRPSGKQHVCGLHPSVWEKIMITCRHWHKDLETIYLTTFFPVWKYICLKLAPLHPPGAQQQPIEVPVQSTYYLILLHDHCKLSTCHWMKIDWLILSLSGEDHPTWHKVSRNCDESDYGRKITQQICF